MLVLMAMGWAFIGVPECALERWEIRCAGELEGGALMLAKAGLPCRGDMFASGAAMSGELFPEWFIGRQSTELTMRGEAKAGCSLLPL